MSKEQAQALINKKLNGVPLTTQEQKDLIQAIKIVSAITVPMR